MHRRPFPSLRKAEQGWSPRCRMSLPSLSYRVHRSFVKMLERVGMMRNLRWSGVPVSEPAIKAMEQASELSEFGTGSRTELALPAP